MKNLNYLMDHILYHIFQVILNILKELGEKTANPSVRIYTNRTENRITFKIKTEYCLELLTPETLELLGTPKSKITNNENGENVPHLEITEVVLVHSNIFNNKIQESCVHLFLINRLLNY